jgi:hypothetical protein
MEDDLDWKTYMRRFPHIQVYGFQRLHVMKLHDKLKYAVVIWTREPGGGGVPLFFVVGELAIVFGTVASVVGLIMALLRRFTR